MVETTDPVKSFRLSAKIVSPGDVRHLRRELETLDDYLRQAAIRTGGAATGQLPRAGQLLESLAADTGANLLQPTDRQELLRYLSHLVETAPVIHFSFASEPSAAFMLKIVLWLRANMHPQLLVSIGLQPSIAAGCVVRTTNKQFDFSLASKFDAQRELLINSLRGDTNGAGA